MKNIITLITCCMALCALATNPVIATKLENGVYTSDHGDIHVLNAKSGSKTVGLYKGVGHILLSSINISGRGTTYTGSFSNGTATGLVAFTAANSKSWKGNWRWQKTPATKWDGSWNGDWLNNNKIKQLVLWNTFYTDLGEMQLIHNPEGKTAGFLYADGKEYYVYGTLVNITPRQVQFSGFITTNADAVKTTANTREVQLNWENGLYGSININGRTKIGIRGASSLANLKITLQTIKNYKNRGVMHQEQRGKITMDYSIFDKNGKQHGGALYGQSNWKTYKENSEYTINAVVNPAMLYTLDADGYYANNTLNIQFSHFGQGDIINIKDKLVAHTVPLKPIMEYLTFKRSASSFANAVDGRKTIPGSDHTFWLTESNGKRTARGYGFIKYSDRDKWGYFYTIELN